MRITKQSDYKQLFKNREILLKKKNNQEFLLYFPIGTTRKVRTDIAFWFFEQLNEDIYKSEIDCRYRYRRTRINSRNWIVGDYKFE